MINLRSLTAKPNNQHPRKIGVCRIAVQYTLEYLIALSFNRHATAGGMGKRRHTVNIRKSRQRAAFKMLSNHLRHRRRTVNGSHHCEIIARADFAISTVITHKRSALFR